MQTIPTVDITVSSIIEDLNKGLTWYQKDDMGFGSIQDKYEANDMQIATIKQHPKLANQSTAKFLFQIIDDTVEGYVPKEQKNSVPPLPEPPPARSIKEGEMPEPPKPTYDADLEAFKEVEAGLPGDTQTYIL